MEGAGEEKKKKRKMTKEKEEKENREKERRPVNSTGEEKRKRKGGPITNDIRSRMHRLGWMATTTTRSTEDLSGTAGISIAPSDDRDDDERTM
ncbi:hypothetical protein L249_3825, partial [Ophiocordyceps polyrhachis-furcata BCC 54312]